MPISNRDSHSKVSGSQDNPDDIPLVKGENVHQGYIDWIGAKHWPADEYDSFAKYHLIPGDVVLAMDRPWVTAGLKWSYIKPHDPKSLLVQRVARLRAKKKLDQDYLRHVISSNYFANYLQPIVTGGKRSSYKRQADRGFPDSNSGAKKSAQDRCRSDGLRRPDRDQQAPHRITRTDGRGALPGMVRPHALPRSPRYEAR